MTNFFKNSKKPIFGPFPQINDTTPRKQPDR